MSRTSRSSAVGLLAVVALAATTVGGLRWLAGVDSATAGGASGEAEDQAAVETLSLQEPGGARPTVERSEFCPSASYLCAGVQERADPRLVRWNEDVPFLRIRVSPPPGEDPPRARLLQEAAARGIRAWQGHPFRLRIDLSERPGDHHFVVGWSPTLAGTELGRTRTRWVSRDGRADLRVEELSLGTRDPTAPSRPLPLEQVTLTAAHEMGHALGLPHSDDPGDVMYPTNTATHLTTRDFAAMEALYAAPNGALLR